MRNKRLLKTKLMCDAFTIRRVFLGILFFNFILFYSCDESAQGFISTVEHPNFVIELDSITSQERYKTNIALDYTLKKAKFKEELFIELREYIRTCEKHQTGIFGKTNKTERRDEIIRNGQLTALDPAILSTLANLSAELADPKSPKFSTIIMGKDEVSYQNLNWSEFFNSELAPKNNSLASNIGLKKLWKKTDSTLTRFQSLQPETPGLSRKVNEEIAHYFINYFTTLVSLSRLSSIQEKPLPLQIRLTDLYYRSKSHSTDLLDNLKSVISKMEEENQAQILTSLNK